MQLVRWSLTFGRKGSFEGFCTNACRHLRTVTALRNAFDHAVAGSVSALTRPRNKAQIRQFPSPATLSKYQGRVMACRDVS